MLAEVSSHGTLGLLLSAVGLLAVAACSRRLAATWISPPMLFLCIGVLVGPVGLDAVVFSLSSDLVRTIVELTLVLVLFSDASRIDLGGLRRHVALPGRLLGIGLPLTILAGVAAALVVFPTLSILAVLLIAVILAPTDAALGQAVVANPRIPLWVRQGLNVESGLNDGIAVPVFTTLTAIAVTETVGSGHGLVNELVRQLGGGLVCGVAVGVGGAAVLTLAQDRGWMSPNWTGIATFLVALVAYFSSVAIGGSGFIAAFCAGMAFGHRTSERPPDAGEYTEYTEETGQMLAAITFVVFGGTLLSTAIEQPSGRAVLYAVLSLTLVRLVPVALSLIRSGSATPTVAFVGWFGPRGLASVLFLVLLIEEVPAFEHLDTIVAAVTWTVTLSVVLHGLSAVPLSDRYASWYAAHRTAKDAPSIAETGDAHEHRLRRGDLSR